MVNRSQQNFVQHDCEEILHEKNIELESLRNSVITIDGGTGFIGSWLSEMVSTLNERYFFNLKLNLISNDVQNFKLLKKHLSKKKFINLINSDVRNLIELPLDTNFIINAAANPDIRLHATYPIDISSTISQGIFKVLDSSLRLSNLKKIVHLSSGLVMSANSENKGIAEYSDKMHNKNSQINIYENSKLFSESVCLAASSQLKLPIDIVRPFNFIGPYQAISGPWAHTSMLNDAYNKRPISIKGDGEVVRSYLYGSDAAFWILKILTLQKSGNIYNLGSDESVTLKSLAKKISICFSPPLEVKINNYLDNKFTNKYFYPDLSVVKAKLNLSVLVGIDNAIKKTIQWNNFGDKNE